MAHQLLPTSNGRGRRARVTRAEDSASCKPPPAPKTLDPAQRAEWRQLWSTTVAQSSWLPEDAPLVVRLLQLRRRCEQEGARWQVEAVRQIEDRLLLNGPRGRQRAGLPAVEPEPPASSSKRNGQRRMSQRERERLLRG